MYLIAIFDTTIILAYKNWLQKSVYQLPYPLQPYQYTPHESRLPLVKVVSSMDHVLSWKFEFCKLSLLTIALALQAHKGPLRLHLSLCVSLAFAFYGLPQPTLPLPFRPTPFRPLPLIRTVVPLDSLTTEKKRASFEGVLSLNSYAILISCWCYLTLAGIK